MNTQTTPSPQFYLTAPATCPYLPGQMERKVFTHLVGPRAAEMNDLLTQGGFRRSQNIAYRPACETCRACVSVRILAEDFQPTRTMRRILSTNSDVISTIYPAQPSTEQFSLFRHYLDDRHQQGGMSDMSALDYAIMVEDTHVNTRLIEYRLRQPGDGIGERPQGELLAVALTDLMSDGLSMVYSFFNTDLAKRSLGTFMILDHVRRTRALGLPHVYLGYWVHGSPKMNYKTRFQPQEHLTARGWERFNPAADE
ncbi:MAG: arginyltransferase [Alphaproteobacteria bacterium]|jgi:leucyl-tRNA---protein transferase|uniref:Aspartate/glutamate leucyltransferase n=1 Tax=Pseudorhizobium pelagicum TaxID=1509405 RepID=A0A922T5M6_9HYPH|nr:arginyltransferase [Pseudorhizobium pelagicum]MBU1317392.1 arginyltransferase [Alphaproteobacteria bacterium]KEQ06718.1 arginyl-tRNA-protein transferase [Pseudorhizobium pelagicum]KEQ08561.1 arginyl-tRNA-protein transferase [Pseudorhizobium pelagicum]MBU1551824.1 arginyltransferase [Alphaproteobacteria bacterium]MBU2335252.1 arginyltransferase [Alphaproteobacteria bacterium]|tara:strand:- start:910 stop:1671 length:762 start_codon:yes stop_codon:yes gene_type:complete